MSLGRRTEREGGEEEFQGIKVRKTKGEREAVSNKSEVTTRSNGIELARGITAVKRPLALLPQNKSL